MDDDAVLKTAIEIEKKLCACLGREWRASGYGISVEILVDAAIEEIVRLRTALQHIADGIPGPRLHAVETLSQ